MTEKTPAEILELAQQRIAARQVEEKTLNFVARSAQLDQNKPWRIAFFSLLGLLLGALFLIPGQPLDERMAAILHGLCSQQHNTTLGGLTFPICTRCSSIYISAMLTFGYLWALGRRRAGRIPPWPITVFLVSFVLALALDGFNSFFAELNLPKLYPPLNELRSLTGMGMGITEAIFLALMLNLSLGKDVDQNQPILQNWRELGSLIALNLLTLVAIYGHLDFLAWPLAFLAFLGMLFILFLINLLIVSLILSYDGLITRVPQLAKPAIFAIFLTLIIVSATSTLRFWLEWQVALH